MPMPTKRASLDEIVSKRRASTEDDGKLYKAIILDGSVEKAGYNSDERSQRFIMSTERADLYGDVVRQDGIVMDDFVKNPVALAFHNHRAPIGWWKDVTKINGRPKRTEGVLTLHAAGTTDAVDEISRLLEANAIKACSIGFMPVEAEWILDEEGRNTWGLDFKTSLLMECSVCSIPANPDALAKAAGGDMRLAAELFERFLDTYCEKTAGGIVVRKDFADAYAAMKGEKTISVPEKTSVLTTTIELDQKSLDRLEAIAERMERAADAVAAGTIELAADPASPEADPVVQELELNVEEFLKDFEPKVEEIDEPERKSALTKIVDGIRGLFKASVPEPEPAPTPADPEVQKALVERLEKIAARHAA